MSPEVEPVVERSCGLGEGGGLNAVTVRWGGVVSGEHMKEGRSLDLGLLLFFFVFGAFKGDSCRLHQAPALFMCGRGRGVQTETAPTHTHTHTSKECVCVCVSVYVCYFIIKQKKIYIITANYFRDQTIALFENLPPWSAFDPSIWFWLNESIRSVTASLRRAVWGLLSVQTHQSNPVRSGAKNTFSTHNLCSSFDVKMPFGSDSAAATQASTLIHFSSTVLSLLSIIFFGGVKQELAATFPLWWLNLSKSNQQKQI